MTADKNLKGGQKHQRSDRDGGGEEFLDDNDEEDDKEDDDEEENDDKEDDNDDMEDTTMPAPKPPLVVHPQKKFSEVEARPRKCRTSMMSQLQ